MILDYPFDAASLLPRYKKLRRELLNPAPQITPPSRNILKNHQVTI